MNNFMIIPMLAIGVLGLICLSAVGDTLESERAKRWLRFCQAAWAAMWLAPPLITIWIEGVFG